MKTSTFSRVRALGAALFLALALGLGCGDDDGAGEDTASPTSTPNEQSPTASPLLGITSGPLFT